MIQLNRLLLLATLACLLHEGSSLQAASREAAILENATAVLCELQAIPMKGIPPAMFRNCQGVAIFPGLIKAALVIGGRHGRGVLVARGPDGSWAPPEFLTFSAASFGHQIGVEGSDLVLVFRTQHSLERMKMGKLTLGADVAVAAGPVGREANLSTDVLLQSGILSWSRTKGLFAGACVEGGVLLMDGPATYAYRRYEQGCLQNCNPAAPPALPSQRLQMKLAELSAPPPPPAVVAPPVVAPAVVAPPVAPLPAPRP